MTKFCNMHPYVDDDESEIAIFMPNPVEVIGSLGDPTYDNLRKLLIEVPLALVPTVNEIPPNVGLVPIAGAKSTLFVS